MLSLTNKLKVKIINKTFYYLIVIDDKNEMLILLFSFPHQYISHSIILI